MNRLARLLRHRVQLCSRRWDQAMAGEPKPDRRKVTDETLARRREAGLVQPVIYRGRMTAIRRKPDNSALFRLLRRQGALRSLGRRDRSE